MQADNVIRFPSRQPAERRECPHCGRRSAVWQIGRILWGYCDRHEVRWVVTDQKSVSRATINRRELRKGLEFLSNFVEVTR